MAYDGFISYSHAADGQLAPALQRGLQRLAKPWNRRRALDVFRDETSLSVNPHLWSSVEAALDESDWFILLASPDAAASEWVNREIEHWLATKDADRLLPVVTDGTWTWDATHDRFDPASTAVPQTLHGVFTAEPRHLDLRWARTETDLDLRNIRFRDAIADLAAPLHGLPKDELAGEDVRQHRRTRRLARGAVTGLALLLVAALLGFGLAVGNAARARSASHRAVHQAQLERAHRLAAQAVNLTNGHFRRALLLAVEARRLVDSAFTQSALLTVLQRGPRLVGFLPDLGGAGIAAAGLRPDGTTLAIADMDGVVRLLALPDRRVLATIATGHRGRIRAVAISPDGRTVATTGDDGTIRLFDARTRQRLGEPLVGNAQSGSVTRATFSPDGHLLATTIFAGYSAELVLWDVATRTPRARVPAIFNGYKQDVKFSPDGARLALAGRPPQVFEIPSLEVTTYPTPAFARSVAFSPDGRVLATGYVSDVEFHDVVTGRETRAPLPVAANEVAFSPDGALVATSQLDGTVTLWRDDGTAAGPPLVGHSTVANVLAFVPDTTMLLTASDSEVALWDLNQISPLVMMTLQAGAFIHNVRFSPGGDLLAAATGFGTVALWDMTTGARSGEPFVAYSDVVSGPNVGGIDVAFSPDGRTLATSGAGQAVALWEAGTHRQVRPALAVPSPDRVAGSPRCFCAVAFSPDGRLLAAGASDGTIALIDVRTWTIRRRLPAHRPGSPGGAIALAFTPRGSRVVSSAQGSVGVDDIATGRRMLLATPPGAEPGGVAFSRDSTRLAIGGGESQLVDTETWRTIRTVGGASRSQLGSVALRFDGKLLATGTYGSASLWDLATGDPLGEPLATGSTQPTLGLAFSPDGTRLAAGDFGGNVLLWDIRPDAWTRKACALAGGNLTRSEWNQYLPADAYQATCPKSGA